DLHFSYEYINSSKTFSVNAKSVNPEYDITILMNDKTYALFENIPIPQDGFSVSIVLSIPDEVETIVYTVDLTRSALSSDATLSYLSYGSLRSQEDPIQNELFDCDVSGAETIIEVPHSSSSVVLIPYASHSMAKVFIKQDSQFIKCEYADAVEVKLADLERANVELQVQAEDSSTKDYVVTFVKNPISDNTELLNIQLSYFNKAGMVIESMDVDLSNMVITLPKEASTYALDIIPDDYSSKIALLQNGIEVNSQSMFNGKNIFGIIVTSESGNSRTYKLEVRSPSFWVYFVIIVTVIIILVIAGLFLIKRKRVVQPLK
ncbi:MAG: hypothetical protein ACYC5K_01110, partial [Saccharofermentanales bacterium]